MLFRLIQEEFGYIWQKRDIVTQNYTELQKKLSKISIPYKNNKHRHFQHRNKFCFCVFDVETAANHLQTEAMLEHVHNLPII